MEKEYNCGFTNDNKWFRYRAAAIIVEGDYVLFAGIWKKKTHIGRNDGKWLSRIFLTMRLFLRGTRQ